MSRLPLLLVSLLAVPALASAAPAPIKTVTAPAHADLLSSVRSHVAALGRKSLASRSVSVRGPLTVPPAFASPRPEHLATVIATAPVSSNR